MHIDHTQILLDDDATSQCMKRLISGHMACVAAASVQTVGVSIQPTVIEENNKGNEAPGHPCIHASTSLLAAPAGALLRHLLLATAVAECALPGSIVPSVASLDKLC